MSDVLKINTVGENNVVGFAACELQKYLSMMDSNTGMAEISISNMTTNASDTANKAPGFHIGIYDDLGLKPLDDRLESIFDDEVYIRVKDGSGIISGVNPRSVLMAVYRLLYEAGCRWVRPGRDGEFIPAADISKLSLEIQERPSYRHRGICIEGAVSLENVTDMIDWLPKVGLNSYFIQFREAYTFFERWYRHTHNGLKTPEPFTIDKAREYVKLIEKEIEKRGLIYHAVGHGWTCEPLGIPGLGWDVEAHDYPPEITQYFAEVKGERRMTDGIPLNLNLCYSSPEVRALIINDIVNYLKKNNKIDILHFWLADGVNNQCKCADCRDTIPSDYYVQMLNELDAALTANNIPAKIVFLIYLDLLWAPLKNKINNQDRYIMMFAPISRSYSYPFEADKTVKDLPEYRRNELRLPGSVAENLGYLRKWQALHSGDSFDYDYHFMWAHYSDPGYVKISEILHKDILNLKKIGLNGLISCQPQRAFLPTGLGMYTLARALWDATLSFEEITADYYSSAFGDDGQECLKIMENLSEQFSPPYLRGEINVIDPGLLQGFSRLKDTFARYDELIKRNLANDDPCRSKSWEYLSYHRVICVLLAEMLAYRAADDMAMTRQAWSKLKEYIQRNEDALQKVLDVYELVQTIEIMNPAILMLRYCSEEQNVS